MLINQTSKKILSNHAEICDTPGSKAVGLMFSRRKRVDDNSLVFKFDRPGRWGLHMFFVFYAIDVLFLDEASRVVEIKKCLRPFTFYTPLHRSSYIIEARKGTIDESRTKIGDVISWKI